VSPLLLRLLQIPMIQVLRLVGRPNTLRLVTARLMPVKLPVGRLIFRWSWQAHKDPRSGGTGSQAHVGQESSQKRRARFGTSCILGLPRIVREFVAISEGYPTRNRDCLSLGTSS
jgi:hypothetical protein